MYSFSVTSTRSAPTIIILNITDSLRVFVIINFFDIIVSENCLICEYIYERINGGHDE